MNCKTFILIFLLSPSLSFAIVRDSIKTDVVQLLKKATSNVMTPEERKLLVKEALNMQNQGFTLEERSYDYQGALSYMDRALMVWVVLKETSKEANNRKYRGLLLGNIGLFEAAKFEINLAIALFSKVGSASGIAVSQFDFSKVYELESKLDSAVSYAQESLKFWKAKGDGLRIVAVDNQLINLYLKQKKWNECLNLQREVESVINGNRNIHWRGLIDFYFLSSKVFKMVGDLDKSNGFRALYRSKIRTLEKEQGRVESIYEHQRDIE